MLTDLYFELMLIADWLWPDDPATCFMVMVISLILAGEAVILSVWILALPALDRWRHRIRVADSAERLS